MRISIIATVTAVSFFLAVPAFAADKGAREEAIGVSSGAFVGGIAGGPVGFVVGAAIGAKFGNTMHKKEERIEELQVSFANSSNTVTRLENDVDALSGEIERLESVARPELIELLQAGIAMDLLFRTDEAVLADTTGDRLAQLAGTLASMSDIHIQLDGFADERGDADYNQGLSERRVQFVRDQLVAAGVHPDQIDVMAHGESTAQDETLDSYALERRVSVKLYIDNAPSLAANPN